MSNIRFESSKNESSSKFTPALAIGAGASLLSGAIGAIGAGKQKREAEKKEREARKEMERLKEVYSNMDISNPFANLTNRYTGMENTAEDLTVNQLQSQFQAQQFQQSQSNILSSLRGAAGSSGIGALAQSLAQQGQIAAQKSSASIGQQEAANIKAKSMQAGRIQEMERRGAANVDQLRAQGAQTAQQRELDRQATLLGMSQSEVASYQQQAQAANQAKWDAISGGISNAASFAGSDGTFGFGTGG
jgi:hypothetical protein